MQAFYSWRAIGYNLVVSLALQKPAQYLSGDRLTAFIEALGRGEHPLAVANRLYPHDRKQARRVRRRLELECLHNPEVAFGVAAAAKVDMLVGLRPVVQAMVKRGARGRVDAGKLIMEASGFHNPRVQHQHSGEIKVKLEMARPRFEQDAGLDEAIDADVVE